MPGTIDIAFEAATVDSTVDFGLLDEPFQRQVIRRLAADIRQKHRLVDINHFLAHPGKVKDRDRLIDRNRRRVIAGYSQENYKQTLLDVYQKVVGNPVRHHIDKSVLLSDFFDLDSFSLLKWKNYAVEK